MYSKVTHNITEERWEDQPSPPPRQQAARPPMQAWWYDEQVIRLDTALATALFIYVRDNPMTDEQITGMVMKMRDMQEYGAWLTIEDYDSIVTEPMMSACTGPTGMTACTGPTGP